MASEDVIELGSSDEDAEPQPKKAKIQKSIPNAMVCIPNKFREVTIKPAKPQKTAKTTNPIKLNPLSLSKVIGKAVTVTKVPNLQQKQIPISNGTKVITKQLLKKPGLPESKKTFTKIKVPTTVLNKSEVNLQRGKLTVIANPKVQNLHVGGTKILHSLKNPVRIHRPSAISLPSTITVKRTATSVKWANIANMPTVKRKPKLPASKPQEVLTVNLDDDDGPPSSSTSSPLWYLRPDDGISNKEEENNKEPENTNFVEITIEDSPIKPIHNKRTCEIGTELAITIDDSPVKPLPEKSLPASGSSGSESDTECNNKVPHSKKKLVYPKEANKQTEIRERIEIELELIQTDNIDVEQNKKEHTNEIETVYIETNDTTTINNNVTASGDKKHKMVNTDKKGSDKSNRPIISKENIIKNKIDSPKSPKVNNKNLKENFDKNKKLDSEVVESIDDDDDDDVLEKSFKDVDTQQTSTPKKKKSSKPTEKPANDDVIISNDDKDNEFHPVYQRFIDLCFCLENSEDMKKIVDKKIKGYYRQVPKVYTESEEFTDIVSSKILAMKADPEKMYLYIKDIVDELNMQRKLAKSQAATSKDTKTTEPEPFKYSDQSEFDSRRRRQIRKLEKTIKKLHRAIQKLEEQEVDFDDEDDSVYLLTERYKERMVRVYAKFCQLTNTKMPSEPRIQIDARPAQPSGPAKRLEKWINKKVPIGTPLPFPDFHDVLRCVRDANEEDKLGWNEADILEEARDLFTRSGKKLQRRRQENEWRSAASRIASEQDPAEQNRDLKKRLEENKQLATRKETDIFNKYADRQNQLKLEAVEIGDKEAEESPIESEDEEANEEEKDPLENTEKRKERLKRLIQGKSKKASVEKRSKTINDKPEVTDETSKADDKEVKINNEENAVETEETRHEKEVVKERDAVIKQEQNVDKDISTKVTDDNQSDNEKKNDDIAETHSISDDSNKVESDIDELHLLQKLPSANDNRSSTIDSSDSGSTIAISDTLDSSGDIKQKQLNDDVISIENSSYSEPEIDNDDYADNNTSLNKSVEKLIHSYIDIDYSTDGVEKVQSKTNNNEYNESVEDILLASSGDETEVQDKQTAPTNNGNTDSCINLRDDLISIDETMVDNIVSKSPKSSLSTKVVGDECNTVNNENKKNQDNVDPSGQPEKSTQVGSVKKNPQNPDEKENAMQEVFSIEEEPDRTVDLVQDGNEVTRVSPIENNPVPDNEEIATQETFPTEKLSENKSIDTIIVKDVNSVEENTDSQPETINEISSIEEIPDSQSEDNVDEGNINKENTNERVEDNILDHKCNSRNHIEKDEDVVMTLADKESVDDNMIEGDGVKQVQSPATNNTKTTDPSQDSVKDEATQAIVKSHSDGCVQDVECMDVDEH